MDLFFLSLVFFNFLQESFQQWSLFESHLTTTFIETDVAIFTYPQDTGYLGNPSVHITSCGTYDILGGSMICGKNYFTSIQYTINGLSSNHGGIAVTIHFVKFGASWTTGSFQVKIDGAVNYDTSWANYDVEDANTCGSTPIMEIPNIGANSGHNGNSVVLEWAHTSDLVAGAYWGLYNMQIYIYYCDTSCLTCFYPTGCTTCYGNSYTSGGICVCNAGYYCIGTSCGNNCLPCDTSCATCNGGTSQDCQSCHSANYYLDIINSAAASGECFVCYSTCKTCQGIKFSDCLSCYSGSYLYNGVCGSTCPSDTFVLNSLCINCYPTCKTCNGIAAQDCMSCYDGYYLDVSGNCWNCDPNCNTCAINAQHCTSCNLNAILVQETCVCAEGYFCYGMNCSDLCIQCDASCKTCSSTYICLSCYRGFYLFENQCLQTCPSPYVPDDFYKKCALCDSTCKTCTGPNPNDCLTCNDSNNVWDDGNCINQCPSNKYLNLTTRFCLLPQVLSAHLNVISTNFIYEIELSEEWPFFLQNPNSYINVEIIGLNNSNYSYFSRSQPGKVIRVYIEYFLETIVNGCKIYIKSSINSQDLDNSFFLNNTDFFDNLTTLCPTNFLYNNETSKCIEKNELTLNLFFTNKVNIIELIFTNSNPINSEFLSILPNSVKIDIQDHKINEDYLYSIRQSPNCDTQDPTSSKCFLIEFAYFVPLIGRKVLTVQTNFSDEYIVYYNLINSSSQTSIPLMDDYKTLSPEDIKKINDLLQGDDVNEVFTTTSLVVFCFFPSQGKISSVLRGLMLAEMTFLLKFINLNYPENLREYFYDRANSTSPIFYKFKFNSYDDNTKIPPIFQLYDYSPFFLDNAGDLLFQNVLIISFSYTFLFLNSVIELKKKKYPGKRLFVILLKVSSQLVQALVWGNALVSYFSTFQQIFFDMICSFVFSDQDDMSGKLNFALAVITLFLRVMIMIYIISVIGVCQNFRANSKKEVKHNQVMSSEEKNEIRDNPQTDFIESKQLFESSSPNNDLVKQRDEIQDKMMGFTSPKTELNEKENVIIKSNDGEKKMSFSMMNEPKAVDLPTAYRKSKIYPNETHIFPKQQMQRGSSESHEFSKEEEILIGRYALLVEEYKFNDTYQKYFMMIDLFRLCLIALIVSVFYDYPFFQIILINIIEWIYFVMTLIKKPFQSTYSTINFIVIEILISIIFLSCLIIQAYDYNNVTNIEERVNLGWTVIYTNFSFRLWLLLMTLFKVGTEVITNFMKERKSGK